MNLLIVGGLGYIGSNVALEATKLGHKVFIIDSGINCDTTLMVDKIKSVDKFYKNCVNILIEDVKNILDITEALESNNFYPDVILHFAALKSVPQSNKLVLKYYENNLNATLGVIKLAKLYNAGIIHSSSCSVYGNSDTFNTDQVLNEPECPYASTKQVDEKILKFSAKSYNLKVISLRYFNPIGTDESRTFGPWIESPEKNVVGILSDCSVNKKTFSIFGDDYDTRDGSCIRDYIDIRDLSRAHIEAINQLHNIENHKIYNVGTGTGTTVKELVDKFIHICPDGLKYKIDKRRPGDVVSAVANISGENGLPNFKCMYQLKDSLKNEYNYLKENV